MFTQARAIVTGLIVLVLLILAAMIYWRGSSNAKQGAALDTARTVITEQRETAKVERKTDATVNRETQQTETRAQEANREIESIRQSLRAAPRQGTRDDAAPARPPLADVGPVARPADPCDAGCARILQLADEARAAAVASSASLQPTRAGAR